jgi:peptidoglycan/LPS O-acetylase OafA/YrhL
LQPLEKVLRNRHLPALDGLRAVAVAVVMVYHSGVEAVPGDLGVTAFFVLSGFLITWLLLKERDRTGSVSLRNFYLRRALRIFPAYFVFVGVSLALDFALGDPWSRIDVISAFTYTINYRNALFGHVGPIAHAWSLGIEEQFYLLWPFLLILLDRVGKLRQGLGWIIAGVCLWRSLLFLGFGLPDHYVYNALDTRFDSLAIGCLMAVLTQAPRFIALAPRLAARAWYPLPVILLLYVSRRLVGPDWHYSLGFSVDSILMALIILQLMQLSTSSAWRWLDSRFAVWMGAVSYPLYLWHIWGLGLADNITRSSAFLPNAILGFVLSFGLASASYYGVEKYFLGIKDRLTRSPQIGSPVLEPETAKVPQP